MSKPKKSLKISVTDTDIFKDTIHIVIGIVEDKRIDEKIRREYFNDLAKIINTENYAIEFPEVI